ncbi:ATP1B2 family protein [Megaselia abdita]
MSKKNGATSLPGPQEFQFPQPKPDVPWGTFIYNKSEGTYFGRTIKSWSKLMIFYVVFYAVLAAMFAICMQGLFNSLSETEPKWQLSKSLIGTNPGLGYRPQSEKETERGSIIQFDSKKSDEKQFWVDLLNEFLDVYNDRTKLPEKGAKQKICGFNDTSVTNGDKVCEVDLTQFGPCSPQNSFGYNNSQPCIFLKLNKIYGWQPDFYDNVNELPEEMPEELKKYIASKPSEERKQVWVSCKGQFGTDKETVNNIKYFPDRGFPSFYYPYLNQPGYLSPLVAVQFERPKSHEMMNVECRAWAKNIIYNGSIRDRMGSVAFQILID